MSVSPASGGTKRNKGTLLVVDGHSLAFRAFFALPVENFSTASGQATNAVWGFITMLAQVIDAEAPDHLAVAFDMKGGTFRNTMLPQYKGTRDAAPEDLLTQLPLIQRLLTALGITYIEVPGYEGDDIIGTMATMGERSGYRTLVLSGDRDAFQLVDDRVTVLYPGHHFKDLKHMTPEAIKEKYRVYPGQYPDLAALRGETADNIPGVPGVGDGYAAKWINQYGSLSGIIEHAGEITGKKGQALRDNIEQVRLNRRVNALVRDLDLRADVEDFSFGVVDADQVQKLFDQLEFGARTQRRVLSTFDTTTVDDHTAAEENTLTDPTTAVVSDAATLRGWLAAREAERTDHTEHTVDMTGSTSDAAFHAVPPSDAMPQTNEMHGGEEVHPTDGMHHIDGDLRCADGVRAGWVLAAQGSPKPGEASLTRLVLLMDDQAAVIDGNADEAIRTVVRHWCEAHADRMIVHGYKEHRHMLASIGIRLHEPWFDTKLAGYLVQPDFHADDVDAAAVRFLDLQEDAHAAVTQGQLDLGDGNGEEHVADPAEVAAHQAVLVRALTDHLAPIVDERRQFGLLRTIELPVSSALFDIERTGAHVDATRLQAMHDAFGADAGQAQAIAWQAAGHEVNLQSPKQLQKVLFEDMGLRPTRKTKSGSYTTNAASLQDLYLRSTGNERANTFLGALLRHRETNKLKQIVQTLIEAVNPRDQRVHTTFEQTVAATGRLSSVDPNLQNIPNRNAAGREIRSAFVPGEGYESLLSCDYSQVELRIMADFSGDEALIEAFRSGADFHKYVASLVYGIPVEDISPDQRSHVKAMSYGLAYGLSTYGLARQLSISPAEADLLKEKYFTTFGKVHDYLESLVDTARTKGYTETMFGRRRYFPALRSTNRAARDAAERGALNAPIQGSAADIMKLAMIRAAEGLDQAGVSSRVILQIHDELVVEVARGEAERVTAIVKDAMEHAVDLAVPLDVSTGIGADWQLAAH